jgi:two-component system sensor histidine kinase/response regulator
MVRIFEPFVQLRPAKGVSEGTGLGLALSRSLVQLLGGELTVRSRVGEGSTFGFGIEVEVVEDRDLRTSPFPSRGLRVAPGQREYRILLVDDDSEGRSVFRHLLEQAGLTVLEADNGQEAVDLHAAERPDLILMDLRMPVMNGQEATRRIREAERGMRDEPGRERHTPIIAVTAHVMERESFSGLVPEFDDLVRKPADVAELIEEIGRHLDVKFVVPEGGASESEKEDTRAETVLSSTGLSDLPRDWLEEFAQASRTGRSQKLLELVDRIQTRHPELARELTGWVRNYRFDRLSAWMEQGLKEASHD